MEIRPIQHESIDGSVAALVSAFAFDPLMEFLFGASDDRAKHAGEFFRILLEVRVSLAMPAYLAQEHGTILGAVMGYDVTRPAWPEAHLEQWSRLLRRVEGLEARLGEYGALAERYEPQEPHYYLGVIGVRDGRKGGGVGKALLESFCGLAASDRNSSGVYLETASEPSFRFYLKNGFAECGEGNLGDGTRLWCVYKSTGGGAAA